MTKWAIFIEDLPQILPNRYRFIWQSGFRGEDFFRNRLIRNKNCLWWPCLLTDQDKISNFNRGPSIDALILPSFGSFGWAVSEEVRRFFYSEWVIVAISAIFQLHLNHGENNLIFNEMMFCSRPTRWVGFVAHWNNSPRIDMSFHSDTLHLFWFRANLSLLFLDGRQVMARWAKKVYTHDTVICIILYKLILESHFILCVLISLKSWGYFPKYGIWKYTCTSFSRRHVPLSSGDFLYMRHLWGYLNLLPIICLFLK